MSVSRPKNTNYQVWPDQPGVLIQRVLLRCVSQTAKEKRPETGSVHPTTPSSCLGLLELVLLWAEAGTATPLLVHAGTLTPSPNLCPSFLPLPTPTHFLLQGNPNVGAAPMAEVSGARTAVVEQGRLAARGGGNLGNQQMKPQQMKQKSHLTHHPK